jgi:hypothetical protein
MTGIGVIGGYGAVGHATVAQLRAWDIGPVVVAGRDPSKADISLDLEDRVALERFCATVRLVVNCSGAPPRTRARVAETAAHAGVPYVDPGGDGAVHGLLAAARLERPVVLSAGMWPGLTGLLPRRLAPAPGSRVVCYVGGQDRFSVAGAADYLAAMDEGAGRIFAVWRDGARVEGAGVPVLDGDVPYFTEPASAVPFLSPEMERLGAHLELGELVFYTVLPGARLREILSATHRGGVDADAVVRASELDLFGRVPYQRVVVQLPDEPYAPTLVLSGAGSADLTGATAALTAATVLEGAIPVSLSYAADVLDPVRATDTLRSIEAVTELRIFEAARTPDMPSWPAEEAVEEGIL